MELKLLLVDDDRVFILLSKKLIYTSHFHQNPLVFENGLETLQFLKNDYSKDSAYLIFLDINMPKMNGWEFLNAIEEFASPENTFVFMLSSSIDFEDKKKAKNNKFVLKYLSKPILLDTYYELKKTPEINRFFD